MLMNNLFGLQRDTSEKGIKQERNIPHDFWMRMAKGGRPTLRGSIGSADQTDPHYDPIRFQAAGV
jgi:hypothetical protein